MELARQFGVHRGTVREALRELETNGVLKRARGSKLMMVTRPARVDVAAGVSRALALHDVTYHDVWEALTALEPPIAAAAARQRKAQATSHASTRIVGEPIPTTVEQTADFFRAVGEATHNGVFMLAHEPLVAAAGAVARRDDRQGSAGRAPASPTAQKRIVAAIRARDSVQADEWMAKHIRDFRRGFEIAHIGLRAARRQAHRIRARTNATGRAPVCSDSIALLLVLFSQAAASRKPPRPPHRPPSRRTSRSTISTPSATSSTRPSRPRGDTWPSSCGVPPTTCWLVMDLQTDEKNAIQRIKLERRGQEADHAYHHGVLEIRRAPAVPCHGPARGRRAC